MKTHALEDYIQHADESAQEVVRAWVVNAKAGNSEYLTPEFKGVFDKAFEYRQSRKIADNHREFNILTEEARQPSAPLAKYLPQLTSVGSKAR